MVPYGEPVDNNVADSVVPREIGELHEIGIHLFREFSHLLLGLHRLWDGYVDRVFVKLQCKVVDNQKPCGFVHPVRRSGLNMSNVFNGPRDFGQAFESLGAPSAHGAEGAFND